MTTWTDSAKSTLEGHLAEMQDHLLATGADPAEVTDDLRRHIDEEVASRRIGVVTTDDVESILARIGLPSPPLNDRVRRSTAGGESPARSMKAEAAATNGASLRSLRPDYSNGESSAVNGVRPKFHGWLLTFGVLLPLLTLAIEMVTRMCASTFFDPIPDIWHVLLVSTVPIFNFLTWRTVRHRAVVPLWLEAGNAFAGVIALYYSFLYATLTPFAMFAIIVFGWGFLPLSPLLSLGATLGLRGLMRRPTHSPEESRWMRSRALVVGLGLGAVAIGWIALPPVLTRQWARTVAEGGPAESARALRWLRSWGHETTLLRDCYATTRGSDPFGFYPQGQPVGPETSRRIFYRVTGRTFNELTPPQLSYGRRGWDVLGDFDWDRDQAGTAVGGRLRGLSLGQSRLDGLVDSDAGWSYTEWTLEFKNVAEREREARAQIALPAGGVVSRVTLWVNGEEREAAFGASGDVRAAYENVVRVVRRDPILVTYAGQDRVLMQCYPVPANGGTIKVRLGITAPLELENETTAILRWPRMIERNFNVRDELQHSIWLEGPQPLSASAGNLTPDQGRPGHAALRGALRDPDLNAATTVVRLPRSSATKASWVTDPHARDGQFVQQRLIEQKLVTPNRVIVVLDGSKAMDDSIADIARALSHWPSGVEFSIVLARDGVEELVPLRTAAAENLREAARRLGDLRGAGGQDNGPALLRAWDLASQRPRGAVLWIHGPQPIGAGETEALSQRLEWRRPDAADGVAPVLHDLQVAPGVNRVAERLDVSHSLRTVPRFGSVTDDLQRLFARWRGEVREFNWVREQFAANAIPELERGKKSSRHLARLWAKDEVTRLTDQRHQDQAAHLAAEYQLVTAVTGAVVLETKQQFAAAGLKPVAAETVPTVPEPGTIVLGIVAALLVVASRWWRKWRGAPRATPGVAS